MPENRPRNHQEPTPHWRRPTVRRLALGLVSLVVLYAWGVVGYILLGWNFSDSIYMVAITVSTVGFTEVRPITGLLRAHTISIIALGTIVVAYLVGAFLQFFTEGDLQRILGLQSTRRKIVKLQNHAIIAGYGRLGSLLCEDLTEVNFPFVVVEPNSARAAEVLRRGFLLVEGDATDEAALHEAGIDHARALVVAVASDSDSVFITLTARQLTPKLLIVARAELPTTQKKLVQAGANQVILTAAVSARRIAALLQNPNTVEFIELVTKQSHLDLEVDEAPILAGDSLEGLSLRDADIGRRTGAMVIAIKRVAGVVEFPPTGDEPLRSGDAIVLIGRRSNLDHFADAFCSPQARHRKHDLKNPTA